MAENVWLFSPLFREKVIFTMVGICGEVFTSCLLLEKSQAVALTIKRYLLN